MQNQKKRAANLFMNAFCRVSISAIDIATYGADRAGLVTELLVAEIARAEQAQAINYMNFVCASEFENNILLSGFGFGAGGVLISRANQERYQPLRQDKKRMSKTISDDCTQFCKAVKRSDEIINYAELPNALIADNYYKSDNSVVNNEQTLYMKLSTDIQGVVDIEGTKQNTAIAQIKIPTEEEQIKNQKLFISRIKQATEKYIAWMEQNAKGIRGIQRFSHFFHGHSGLQRAQHILDLIEGRQVGHKAILEATQKAFEASGSRQHSYSRYLFDAITLSQTFENNVSDREFAQQKTLFQLN